MPVLVVGLGSFGGGVGVARWLAELGARVLVTDLKGPEQLAPSLAALEGLPIEYRLGGHDAADLERVELVVASPAVPRGSALLRAARRRGLPITSEMNLFFARCPGRICGVTGSNGKTTTTHLVAEILCCAGRTVHLGGNLGRSLLGELPRIAPADDVVLELSSFQLEELAALRRSPAISVLTNLTPNHLDRHGTFEAYARAKLAIFRHQDAGGVAVLNADDPGSAAATADCPGRVVWFSTRRALARGLCRDGEQLVVRDGDEQHALCDVASFPLPGEHNLSNLLAAAGAALAAGAGPADVAVAAARFEGVPHRLERVGRDGRRTFYNDSIATTPESTIAALHALDGPLYLLVGGYDKGCELLPLAQALRERAAGVVLLGALGARLFPLLEGAALVTRRAPNFRAAFEELLALSDEGTLLLSPAAASYDEFGNFTERGDLFRRLVAERLGPS